MIQKFIEMVHIVNGQVVESRSPWRLSIIPEIFWGVVNFVSAFFQSLVGPLFAQDGNARSSYGRPGSGQAPPRPPGGGRFRGFGGGGGPAPPPAGGG